MWKKNWTWETQLQCHGFSSWLPAEKCPSGARLQSLVWTRCFVWLHTTEPNNNKKRALFAVCRCHHILSLMLQRFLPTWRPLASFQWLKSTRIDRFLSLLFHFSEHGALVLLGALLVIQKLHLSGTIIAVCIFTIMAVTFISPFGTQSAFHYFFTSLLMMQHQEKFGGAYLAQGHFDKITMDRGGPTNQRMGISWCHWGPALWHSEDEFEMELDQKNAAKSV